ncbi:MAG: hypothetical protein IJZ29_05330 [Clostridia bacterium]|nr:hypothetical protein [Clostridia bacterium]
MAFWNRNKSKGVVTSTYTYQPTGETNDKGWPKYKRVGGRTIKEYPRKKFGEFKKDTYNESKANNNIYVSYKPRQIDRVTKRNKDGSKTVTFVNRMK